jgi:hypothetical protein
LEAANHMAWTATVALVEVAATVLVVGVVASAVELVTAATEVGVVVSAKSGVIVHSGARRTSIAVGIFADIAANRGILGKGSVWVDVRAGVNCGMLSATKGITLNVSLGSGCSVRRGEFSEDLAVRS